VETTSARPHYRIAHLILTFFFFSFSPVDMTTPTTNNDTAQIEYEKTIKIKIPRAIFFAIKERQNVDPVYVLYFGDERVSQNIKQMKKVCEQKQELIYFNDKFLPCRFTKSTEVSLLDGKVNFAETTKIVERYILYSNFISDLYRSCRVSIDKSIVDLEITYYYCVEIEFDINQYCANSITTELVNTFHKYLLPHFDEIDIQYDEFSCKQFGSIPSRRFESIVNLKSAENIIIKAKYDGIKGKFCNGYYMDDNLKSDNRLGSIVLPEKLQKYKNIIFQYELMQSGNIILTDVIGCYINKLLYSCNPSTVLAFFGTLQLPANSIVYLNNIAHNIYCQRELTSEPIDKIDGYIIVAGESEYKYKVPSCDVRCKKEFLYLDSSKIPISYKTVQYPDGIYEIIMCGNIPKIIRQRFDRNYTSVRKEYDEFIEQTKFYSNNGI